jgi:beta-lactamase regulating signal transducer with metallopeptidase domain
MMVPELQTLARIFTECLLNTAAEGIVLAGLVWAILRLVGRQNSGTRFAIWFSALVAIVVLPFVSGSRFIPSHFIALPPASLHRQIVLSPSIAFCLFVVWALVASLLLFRLSLGLWRVVHFRRDCSELDLASFDPAIGRIVRDFESGRRVKLYVSSGATVPAAIGFFRPAIVFPAWLLPQLSADEIRIILLHELAHLRRRDDWTNLAQKVVKAVFFFHPAVWWIENRLTLEREMACDEMVLAQTASARAYASSLISFAEKLQGRRGLSLAQALVSRMHQMSLRLAQILDAKSPRRTALWRPALGLTTGVLALAVGAAPYIPRLVAFQVQASPSASQQVQAAQTGSSTPVQPVAMIRPVAERAAQVRPAHQARAISASFHSRTSVPPLKLKRPSLQPVLIRANTGEEEHPIQQTIFILRTTQYDVSGSGVWTLCIWRVGGSSASDRQFDSAIFVSVI